MKQAPNRPGSRPGNRPGPRPSSLPGSRPSSRPDSRPTNRLAALARSLFPRRRRWQAGALLWASAGAGFALPPERDWVGGELPLARLDAEVAAARGAKATRKRAGGPKEEAPQPLPVLLVHGINGNPEKLAPLARHLTRRGFPHVASVALVPNDGSAPLETLADLIDGAAAELREASGQEEIDVVGFSMGALTTRVWLSRGGAEHVRRFVSLSGPHHGTVMAHLAGGEGIAQMRPGSPLLTGLPERFDGVEVFSFWTPFDLILLPADTSRLEGAVQRTFSVAAHPLMLLDGRVHRAVAETLREESAPDVGPRSAPRDVPEVAQSPADVPAWP